MVKAKQYKSVPAMVNDIAGEEFRETFSAEAFGPGTMGCHELIHILSIAVGFVEDHVVNHGTMELHPTWKKKAERAVAILADLYSTIGQKHFEQSSERTA